MIIKDLELTHFGQFHGKKIIFQPGMNIYYGENEAGKSTIHAFIKGMLFGIERQKGRAAKTDRYTRYEPWDNHGAYEGKMRIEADGTTYRLERSFLKTDRYFHLYDETNGDELEPAQEKLKELLSGMTESSFANTVCIEQMKSATDVGLMQELQKFVCNTGNTKSTEIDLTAAIVTLKMQKKRMENRLISTAAKDFVVNKKDLKENEEELEQLRVDQTERLKEGEDLKAKLKEEREFMVSVRNSHRREKEELRKKYEEVRSHYNEYLVNTHGLSKKNVPSMMMVAICLLALCAIGYIVWSDSMGSLMKFFFIIILAVITIGCGAAAYFYSIYFKQQREEIHKQLEEKEELKHQCDKYEENYLHLASNPPENNSETHMILVDKIKALQESLGRLSWDIEQKEERGIELLNEQDVLLGQQEDNAKIQSDIQAAEYASEVIQKLANKVHNSFGTELNEKASELLSLITNGKYKNLVVKEDMSIFLNTPERYVSLGSVSRGTIEQIYLCIRLAAAGLLWEKGDMFFLFDDIFVFYDDKRLKETMNFLSGLSNQVIIFTCQKRELEYQN